MVWKMAEQKEEQFEEQEARTRHKKEKGEGRMEW